MSFPASFPCCPAAVPFETAPTQLLPAIPYLVGYRPSDSVVAVFLQQDRSLAMSARLDWDVCRADPQAAAQAILDQAMLSSPCYVLVAAVDPAPPDGVALTAFAATLADAGLIVIWAGDHQGETWRSPECDAMGCDVHRLDPAAPPAIVTHLVSEGRAPRADRTAIAAEVAASPAADHAATSAVRRPRNTGREAWRDELLRAGTDLVARGPGLSDSDVAVLAAASHDIRVRDVLLWRLTRGPELVLVGWATAWEVLAEALRRCAPADVAPVAAVAAVAAWQLGDGIRAGACLDRAAASDPDHSLAALVRRSLAAGCPPSVWRDVMAGLTEDECRFGREVD